NYIYSGKWNQGNYGTCPHPQEALKGAEIREFSPFITRESAHRASYFAIRHDRTWRVIPRSPNLENYIRAGGSGLAHLTLEKECVMRFLKNQRFLRIKSVRIWNGGQVCFQAHNIFAGTQGQNAITGKT